MPIHLTEEDYEEIKRLRKEGVPNRVLALQFNRGEATISNICNGKSKPRQAKTERLNKRLTDEEYETIRQLAATDMAQRLIALKIGRSCSVVCMALKQLAEKEGRPPAPRRYKDVAPMESIDLSKLPDTVLFKHSREFCF